MKPKIIEYKIPLPEGVEVSVDGMIVKARGPKGEFEKKMGHPKINVKIEGKEIILSTLKPSKREKKIIGTFRAHFKNIIKGVTEGFIYKMKICSGHFPMNVAVSNNELQIKNFFGEKIPRILKIKEGASVKVEGDVVIVESVNKELAGQVAADIETLTRRVGFDKRIFQDGIYIIEKSGKEL